MKWTFRLGTLAGTEVRVHATFFILIAWLVLNYGLKGQAAAEIAIRVGLILALFGCVVLHELGHAAAARRYGIRTLDITLLPIGGLARLERIPREPQHELVIALAGPAVNAVIAAVLAAGLWLAAVPLPAPDFDSLAPGALAWNLAIINVVLAIFNLIPAFPMDGGRVLRAMLAMRMSYVRATRHAATIGQTLAFIFGFVGLLFNPFLILIAVFVWIGAASEATMVSVRSALQGLRVRQAMISRFVTLTAEETLQRAVELTLEGSQKDFPVVRGGRLTGLLTQRDLLSGLARGGRDLSVGDAMHRDVLPLGAEEELTETLERFGQAGGQTAPVVAANGQLIGLLTMDNVSELLGFQRVLGDRSMPASPPRPLQPGATTLQR